MNPQQAAELVTLKSHLVRGMEGYMAVAGEGCGYGQEDIRTCLAVIDSYLAAISHASNPVSMMGEVERAVVELNQLNVKCNGGLIETEQREEICKIINSAAGYAGFDVGACDLTEEWREW